jgi:hypothetical protein
MMAQVIAIIEFCQPVDGSTGKMPSMCRQSSMISNTRRSRRSLPLKGEARIDGPRHREAAKWVM